MKKSELVKIIRESVRSELLDFLPVIVENLGKNNNIQNIKKENDIVESTKIKLQGVRKQKNNKTYSKNEVINQILNETVGGIPSEGAKVGSEYENTTTDFNGNSVNIENFRTLSRTYTKLLRCIDCNRQEKR